MAEASGGVITLVQYITGEEEVNTIRVYYDEVKELAKFVSTLSPKD